MTGLRTSAEPTQAGTSINGNQSHTGFPFSKIVYVGDVSGELLMGCAMPKSWLTNARRIWWWSTRSIPWSTPCPALS